MSKSFVEVAMAWDARLAWSACLPPSALRHGIDKTAQGRRWWPLALIAGVLALARLAGCQSAAPVEFALGDPQADLRNDSGAQLDFRGMDEAIATCKQATRGAAANRCAQVRAYESCMHGKGYVTLLGPDTPGGCGETDWQRNLHREMKVLRRDVE